MNVEAGEQLEALLRDVLDAGDASGVAAAYGIGNEDRGMLLLGRRAHADDAAPVTARTRWDLASLTKVLATVPTVLQLVDERRLRLDMPVSDVLPQVGSLAGGEATIAQLLSHQGGFAPEPPRHAGSMLEAVLAAEQVPPGHAVVYSDVGYLALAVAIERIEGAPLDHVFARRVVDALGLQDTTFGHAPCTATASTGVACEGDVVLAHDPTAQALGTCGHAGMFASLNDVIAMAKRWIAPDGWMAAPTVRRAFQTQTTGLPGGRRGLGWSLEGDPFHCAPTGWDPGAASHSGYTGTSVTVSRATRAWAVLLTNCLPRGGDAGPIIRLRRSFHQLVAASLSEEIG